MAVVEPETVSGYRVTRTIARTAHGAVLIGHDPEAGVAVLKVRHGAEAIADTVREAAALQRGAGAHVVRLRDVATSPSAEGEDRGVLVLERCEGGTLAELLRRRRQFDAGEAVTLLAPVIATLARLHDSGVAHGALAPEHIGFGARGEPQLIGWGRSVVFEANTAEVVREREPGVQADRRAVRALVSRIMALVDPGAAPARDRLCARLEGCADEDLFELCERVLFEFAPAVPLRGDDPASGAPALVDPPTARRGSTAARQLVPARPMDGDAGSAGGEPHSRTRPFEVLLVGILPDRVLHLLDAARRRRWEVLAERAGAPRVGEALARIAGAWDGASRGRRRVLLAGGSAALVVAVGVLGLPSGGSADLDAADEGPAASGSAVPELAETGSAVSGSAVSGSVTPGDAGADPSGESIHDAAEDGPSSTVLLADDPRAASAVLVETRERCLDELSILCLDQVFQQGSAAMDADRDVILVIQSGGEATATRWSIDSQPSEWIVVERLGGTALIRLGPESTAASLLLMKGEAGWRIREYLAMSSG